MQKCLHGEYYYKSCEIYGDTYKSTTILAHSTDTWSLCNSAPPLKNTPISNVTNNFDQWLLEENRRMAHQGFLDEYSDYNVFAADLEEAQGPLKPSIYPPAVDDWERTRKYFGYVPAKVVRNTYKYSTQHCVLSSSSHLQKHFKSPDPLLNLHRRNEADATNQILSDTSAMDGGETSAHIFVGHDSKIVDVYKAKHNNAKVWLGTMQDRVQQRGIPTQLIVDNAPMYRGWKVTKYLCNLVLPLWQCETKHQHQNPAEDRYQTVKQHTNQTMDRSGTPPATWFLCLVYICFCLNQCINPSLGDRTNPR